MDKKQCLLLGSGGLNVLQSSFKVALTRTRDLLGIVHEIDFPCGAGDDKYLVCTQDNPHSVIMRVYDNQPYHEIMLLEGESELVIFKDKELFLPQLKAQYRWNCSDTYTTFFLNE